MSDGEMERIDEALSAAFRSRLFGQSNTKKKKGHLFVLKIEVTIKIFLYR